MLDKSMRGVGKQLPQIQHIAQQVNDQLEKLKAEKEAPVVDDSSARFSELQFELRSIRSSSHIRSKSYQCQTDNFQHGVHKFWHERSRRSESLLPPTISCRVVPLSISKIWFISKGVWMNLLSWCMCAIDKPKRFSSLAYAVFSVVQPRCKSVG